MRPLVELEMWNNRIAIAWVRLYIFYQPFRRLLCVDSWFVDNGPLLSNAPPTTYPTSRNLPTVNICITWWLYRQFCKLNKVDLWLFWYLKSNAHELPRFWQFPHVVFVHVYGRLTCTHYLSWARSGRVVHPSPRHHGHLEQYKWEAECTSDCFMLLLLFSHTTTPMPPSSPSPFPFRGGSHSEEVGKITTVSINAAGAWESWLDIL